MDQIQERVLREADALGRARTPAAAGRSHCQQHDCGDPIAPERTALGAVWCLECQHERDARAVHFATWRR